MTPDFHARIKEFIHSKRIAYLSFDAVGRNGVFDFAALIPSIEAAYRVHYQGEVGMPKSEYLKYRGRPSYDRIIPLLGHLGGEFQISGLKEICSSTRNVPLGFPRASGLIILNDPETQRPFAILEASQISAARTAAVTGLAVQRFGPKSFERAAWLGAGYLAETHARMWSQLYRDRCGTIHFYDPSRERCERFLETLASLGLTGVAEPSAESAVRKADLILPMTTSETPYIQADWIRANALYTAVSLLDPELDVLRSAKAIVVDDLELSAQEGRPLQKLMEQGETGRLRIHSMGQVLCEDIHIVSDRDGFVFFNPMGTVITDLAAAAAVLNNAIANGDYQSLEF